MRPVAVFFLFLVSVSVARAACGDGIVDGGEQCDFGLSNGASTSCCALDCTFRPSGSVCRPIGGPCDLPETCTGSSGVCPSNLYKPAGSACRAANGPCDETEYCTGLSTSCPANAFKNSSTLCRPAAGVCDTPEYCTGVQAQCPVDAFASNLVLCRAKQDLCDIAEYCTGTSVTCPPDALVVAGAVCRAAAGDCDVAEVCNGVNISCPVDVLMSSDTVCREQQGDCDIAENCTGTDPTCPVDTLIEENTVCRPADGPCDLAEVCSGINAQCPVNDFVPLGVVCSPAVGECDKDAVCTGRNAQCPNNELLPGYHVCRPSAGPCDPPEYCFSSNTAFCVADNIYGSLTVCRESRGPCDLEERCAGVPECPPDEFRNTTIECRPQEGPCDQAEFCPGDSPFCPVDKVQLSSFQCNVASNDCTTDQFCTGYSYDCPPSTAPDGAHCSLDGNLCFTDTCFNGSCVGGPDVNYNDGLFCNGVEGCQPIDGSKTISFPPICDDGDSCTIDTCSEMILGCVYTPLPSIGSLCGSDVGECSSGVLQCVGTGPEPVFTCFGEALPSPEVCSDGLDNDCDGLVDEFCTPLACTVDADCDVLTLSTCENVTCEAGFCFVQDLPLGAPCNDGLGCTTNDQCSSFGTCEGTPVVCDDSNVCTLDTCLEPYGSCVFDGAPLRNHACSRDDSDAAQCDGRGLCVSTIPIECPVAGPGECRQQVLNMSTLLCDEVPRTGACDDGDLCTLHDFCLDTLCFGVPRDCDDGLPCTSDSCNSITGECQHVLNGGWCYIGGVCYGDYIENPLCPCQVCNASYSTIEWSFVSSEQPCDDGDPCTDNDTCRPLDQVCLGEPTDCSAGDSECTVGVCDRGECRIDPINEGQPCDDNNLCTSRDTCRSGVCKGEAFDYSAYSSESGCMIATCDGVDGLVLRPAENYTACNEDGDPCLGPFVCLSGECVSIGPFACPEPTSACMEAVCESGYGCSMRPRTGQACDDGNACTLADVCNSNGECQPSGITVDCDDHDPCTDDLCLADSGCAHVPIGSCTSCRYTDDCSPQLCQYAFCIEGTCTYFAHEAGTSCSDGDTCNGRETCTGNGVCVSEGPLVCDDGNPCTVDGCDPFSGCYHIVNTSNPCDDGDLCTVNDACGFDGVCTGDPFPCPDETTCLRQECFVIDGQPTCVRTPQNAGVWCRSESGCVHSATCDRFGECRGEFIECPPPTECVDAFVCTELSNSTCVPIYSTIGTPCRTNDLCAEHMCDGAGTCTRTESLVNCSHHDECTAYGVCIPQTGECAYVYVEDGTPCDDGDACTATDTCKWGECTGRDPVVCTSLSQCHAPGVCDSETGLCSNPVLPLYTPCVDNDICSTGTYCFDGNCVANEQVQCPSSDNQCLVPRCDTSHGCLYDYATGACDDGNACTFNETCTDGVCGGGVTVNCSHTNTCGVSYCSPLDGCLAPVSDECHTCDTTADCAFIPCKNATCLNNVCVYSPLDSAVSGCNDGLWRNGEEYCFAGTCVLGVPPSCDDGNPCTADSYSSDFDGCVHQVQEGLACQSDDPCAIKSTCNAYGQCVPFVTMNCDDTDDCKIPLGCNPHTGTCEYELKPDGASCVDDNLCTIEATCSSGVCVPVTTLDCSTDCSCKEAGICDRLSGQCVTQESCQVRTCSDGNLCTLGDQCANGDCRAGVYSPCEYATDIDFQCRVAVCDELGSCSYAGVDDGTPCDTGHPIGPCSGFDVCNGGVCTRTYAEGKPCREKAPGGCDVTDKCVHGQDYCPEDKFELDGTFCPSTLLCYGSLCQSGVCTPTLLRDCSAFDGPCTVGECDDRTGQCVARNIADDTECVSGEENQCTPFSTCRTGVCVPYYANELTLCEDGDPCTRESYCSGYDGTCGDGIPVDCSYLDSDCGTGFCDTLTGDCQAQTLNEGMACNADDSVCTPNDSCHAGYCVADTPIDCSYLDSPCQHGRCVDGECTVVITGPECEPDYCTGGCVVPFQWWALHTSRCKTRSKRFTWPDDLEDARICGQSFYYWSQKRARVAWRLLMHQWLAATLNEAAGACVPSEIDAAMGEAYNLLLMCNMTVNVTGSPGKPYRQLASLLAAYNAGNKNPDTCLRPSCAQQHSPANYFACLFPQLNARDVEEVSPGDCVHGMWDYVSDVCDCELGWAGPTCTDCAVPDEDDHTFVCVPQTGEPDLFILRAIPDEVLPMYINDDPSQLIQLLKLFNGASAYPGTGELDCACNRVGELSARNVIVYGDISVYATEIERDLEGCEQLFQVVVVDNNLDCDPNTTIVISDQQNCTGAPDDWTFICDCCGPDDTECVCPRNDIMCLRSHLQLYHSRMELFRLLVIIFIGITGLFIFTSIYLSIHREKPREEKTREVISVPKPIQVKFSYKTQ